MIKTDPSLISTTKAHQDQATHPSTYPHLPIPSTYPHQPMPIKPQDKYLGDILNEGGLKESVQATISERYGKAFASIREIGAVINNFRINAIGCKYSANSIMYGT